MGGWSTPPLPRPIYPWERPGTRCIEGWVGLRDGLDGCRRLRLNRDSIPGPSRPLRVAILTELYRPALYTIYTHIHTYIHIYIHIYIHTYTHTYIHTYINTYIHTHTHTYLHTYIYTYIHIYIHMYKQLY